MEDQGTSQLLPGEIILLICKHLPYCCILTRQREYHLSPLSYKVLPSWSNCFQKAPQYIYRIFHPTIAEHTFSISLRKGTFSKIDCMLSHKMCLRKFKETVIIPSMLSDHNDMKQDIINRGKMGTLRICGN